MDIRFYFSCLNIHKIRNDIGLYYKNRDDCNSNCDCNSNSNSDCNSFIIQAKGKALFKA